MRSWNVCSSDNISSQAKRKNSETEDGEGRSQSWKVLFKHTFSQLTEMRNVQIKSKLSWNHSTTYKYFTKIHKRVGSTRPCSAKAFGGAGKCFSVPRKFAERLNSPKLSLITHGKSDPSFVNGILWTVSAFVVAVVFPLTVSERYIDTLSGRGQLWTTWIEVRWWDRRDSDQC